MLTTMARNPRPEQNKPWIDEAFGAASSVEEIVRRLEAMAVSPANRSAREWAQTALDSLAKASPTALKVRFILFGERAVSVLFLADLCPAGEHSFETLKPPLAIFDFNKNAIRFLA